MCVITGKRDSAEIARLATTTKKKKEKRERKKEKRYDAAKGRRLCLSQRDGETRLKGMAEERQQRKKGEEESGGGRKALKEFLAVTRLDSAFLVLPVSICLSRVA